MLRLKEIRLAGFKSFVDPTRICLASNLSAIVGPNGCGKSNVIDAIRLVMGESSASKLRGGQIADMIFNGSANRKPVGQASVELIFDNSSGAIGGEYARFSEIAIRRQINRDGTSKYALNGTTCRRRDITDIFLGTGIGPRSYSIIEQGMVSRIIEAKPEDMRAFLEEAAQISRYRERRRETELRMSHTRENLDRLNDLRDELERQLNRLERQAESARKYQQYQQEHRQYNAELLAIEWNEQAQQLKSLDAELATLVTTIEKARADSQSLETDIEKQKQNLHALTEARDAVQRTFYQITNEANKLEQELKHRRQRASELTQDDNRAKESFSALEQQLAEDIQKEQTLSAQLKEISPQLHAANERAAKATESCKEAETALSAWQSAYDALNREAAAPARRADVLKTSLAHLEEKIRINHERRQQLSNETDKLDIATLASERESLSEQQAKQESQAAEITSALQIAETELSEANGALETQRRERDALAKTYQVASGRLASLEALQQAALGQDDTEGVSRWLSNAGLDGAARLGEQLVVAPEWQRAVETVLGQSLQALCISDFGALDISDIPAGLTLFNPSVSADTANLALTPLRNQLENPEQAGQLLSGIYCAQSLAEAFEKQSGLAAGESLITPEGIWVSKEWIRMPADQNQGDNQGVLARQSMIGQLEQEIQDTQAQQEACLEALERLQAACSTLEEKRRSLNQQRHEADRALGDVKSSVASIQGRLEQQQKRRSQIQEETRVVEENIRTAQQEMDSMRAELETVLETMSAHTQSREALELERPEKAAAVDQARQAMREDVEKAHKLELEWQGLENACQSTRVTITRAQDQQSGLAQQLEQLKLSLDETLSPIDTLTENLENQLHEKLAAEQQLTGAQTELKEAEAAFEQLNNQHEQARKNIGRLHGQKQSIEMDRQSAIVRQQGFESQFEPKEEGQTLSGIVQQVEEGATADAWRKQIETLAKRMQRLEPINLAAIDEFTEQSERKQYLDSQHNDLTEALAVLEEAIAKIDKETRERFQETFETVNENFQKLFPRLFGGGRATLQLTGDDFLDSGISVIAQPPGKRNSMIQQLSGGEKALVAVALVFSIFQLNPAPFCLLDEVDAPLDDANVGRFTEMVREMSDKTQFIFITHNKITMALADVLMGVTMREPGVSRIVSVNVEEAAELAEM